MRVKLDKVCKRIYAGGDVPKDRYSTVKTAECAIPIYANAEKDNGLYGYTDTARENELSITVAARGTIGFTAIRREPFLPVVRLITVVPDLSTVSERYLYYALRNCKPASSGTSIPQLTVPDIKKNEIELYSLSVQETIADKLDAVGGVIELRQQQLQTLDELVKARFVELFGNMVYNPNGWKKVNLGSVCDVRDGTHDSPKYFPVGYPLVTSKNVTSGRIDFTDCSLICKEDYDKINERSRVDFGDILMPMIGTVGKPVVVDVDADFAIKNVALIKFYEDSKVINTFVRALLQSDYFDRAVISKIRGGTQKFIALSDIRKLEFYLPPMDTQNQFAAFVGQTDKAKLVVQKALDETQLLFDSLMQKYFG